MENHYTHHFKAIVSKPIDLGEPTAVYDPLQLDVVRTPAKRYDLSHWNKRNNRGELKREIDGAMKPTVSNMNAMSSDMDDSDGLVSDSDGDSVADGVADAAPAKPIRRSASGVSNASNASNASISTECGAKRRCFAPSHCGSIQSMRSQSPRSTMTPTPRAALKRARNWVEEETGVRHHPGPIIAPFKPNEFA